MTLFSPFFGYSQYFIREEALKLSNFFWPRLYLPWLVIVQYRLEFIQSSMLNRYHRVLARVRDPFQSLEFQKKIFFKSTPKTYVSQIWIFLPYLAILMGTHSNYGFQCYIGYFYRLCNFWDNQQNIQYIFARSYIIRPILSLDSLGR